MAALLLPAGIYFAISQTIDLNKSLIKKSNLSAKTTSQNFIPSLNKARISFIKSDHIVSQLNTPVDSQIFKNKWTLVFTGYIQCPDICPMTLNWLREIKKKMPSIQIVFLVFNSTKKDLKAIDTYIKYFKTEVTALVGPVKAMTDLASQIGASFNQTESGGFQHSTAVFLVDPGKTKAGEFIRADRAEETVGIIKALKSRYIEHNRTGDSKTQ